MNNNKILLININNLEYIPSIKNHQLVNQFAGAFSYFENMCPNVEIDDDYFSLNDYKTVFSGKNTLFLLNKNNDQFTSLKNIKTFVYSNNQDWQSQIKTLNIIKYTKQNYELIFANFDFDNSPVNIIENFDSLDYFLYELLDKQEYTKLGYQLILIINSGSKKSWFITTNKKDKLNIKSKKDVINWINNYLKK
ncbi:hypothetical protein [Mycoplasmopsis primatum]|uniref:hypothetical protein n=1 Tax=Mycoplasmopsis primatum TaxID=55604 RepID=UPI0004971AED|nr:hypothetical protein [Mycoplasmopsis primatum]